MSKRKKFHSASTCDIILHCTTPEASGEWSKVIIKKVNISIEYTIFDFYADLITNFNVMAHKNVPNDADQYKV